jgi:hypothetical protein
MLHDAHFSLTLHATFAPSPLRFFFALPEMAVGRVRVAWFSMSSAVFLKVRFATDTAAFAYASFPQDQQIKSNFNQAKLSLLKLFLPSHNMRALWCHSVSQITVS